MLALLLAAALAPEEPETDVDDFPEPPNPCTVEWDDDISPNFIELTEPRILRRCSDLADTMNYDGPPESIHIDVTGELAKFHARVSITNDGELIYDSEPSEVCECGPSELATLAMQRVVVAFEALKEPEDDTPPPKPPHGGDDPPEHHPPPPPAKHTLRWVGLGVGLVGVGALAAGVPLHFAESRSDTHDPAVGVGENVERKDRALTVPLIVGGSVGIVAGVSLIIYDAVKTKRDKGKRATLTPSIAPTWAGLNIRGRF